MNIDRFSRFFSSYKHRTFYNLCLSFFFCMMIILPGVKDISKLTSHFFGADKKRESKHHPLWGKILGGNFGTCFIPGVL